jgi:hypothetical protein
MSKNGFFGQGDRKMDYGLDKKFIETSETILGQLGFKNLKSFVKSQTLMILLAKIDKYEAEARRFEKKYEIGFEGFEKKLEAQEDKEIFEEEDDYLDWRFSIEALNTLRKQKQDLEYA